MNQSACNGAACAYFDSVHNWEKNTIFPRGYLVKNLGYINDKKAIQESLLSKYILDMKNIKHSFTDIHTQFDKLKSLNVGFKLNLSNDPS